MGAWDHAGRRAAQRAMKAATDNAGKIIDELLKVKEAEIMEV